MEKIDATRKAVLKIYNVEGMAWMPSANGINTKDPWFIA
jgi:hypothetical protein